MPPFVDILKDLRIGSLPWWLEEDPTTAAKGACDAAAGMRSDQRRRWSAIELALCLYDDAEGDDLDTSDFTFTILDDEQGTPLNLVRSCVDTVRAELIQSKPRPKWVPAGADWSVRRRCQQIDRFVLGIFNEDSFDRLASAIVLDCLLFGVGIVRVIVEDGKPSLDRIPPWELWCDPDEARYGQPRTLYLTRYASRDVLAARYPDSAEAIYTGRAQLGTRRAHVAADQVAYVEAWHLPSAPDAGDGRHVLCVDGEMLAEEPWEHDWFPFAVMRWKPAVRGFWPKGLASELKEPQRELNIAVANVQEGQSLNTHTHILASRNSGLDPEEMTDEAGVIWWFNGGHEPKALTFPGVSPETYQWIRDTISWGYQLSGISAAAARSERTAGLTSGEAIKTNSDLQSRRFIDPQRAFEQLHVDVGRTLVRVVEHHARTDKSLEVVYRGKHRAERIKWSAARLDESSYVVRIDPTSALPSTAAGRVDWVASMAQSGQAAQAGVPPQMLQRTLGDLDTESLQQFVTVAFDLVDEICERILDEGEEGYIRPEPFFNLSVCVLVAVVTYQQWTLYGAPEDRRDLLRDWIDEARELLERQAPPAPAPGAAAPGGVPPPEALPAPEMAA